MRYFLFSIILFLASFINAQDTIKVQTLTYDSTGRNYMFDFPPDDGTSYEKILMRYSMRCKNGLISNSNDRNKGCGEWDYSCNTYIRDSSYTDSVKAIHPTHIISNFTGSTFNYTTNPTNTYYKYTQKSISYTDTTSEDSAILGMGNELLNHPFGTSNSTSKSQYLWTAAELTSAGLTANNITGMLLDINTSTTTIDHLKVKLKHTNQNTLDASHPETDGFTQVYFLNTPLTTGSNRLDFYNNFNWNGSSNVLVEISFTNTDNTTDNIIIGHNAGSNVGLITQGDDYSLQFTGVEYVDVGNTNFGSIQDEITISFWSYGSPDIMPTNSTLFEGTDNANRRQVSTHLPWGNSRVYWDCGNDGNYDRIDEQATTNDFEGKWNHWAYTKNASTGEMKMYLNGNLWHSGTSKTRTIDLKNLRIGSAITFSNAYYGLVDEFRVWDAELSQSEISDWMYKSITSSHPNYGNLVAYYTLNEGSGTTINDISTAAESGNLLGSPQWKKFRGNSIYKGFTTTTFRPNITFLQGVYTSSVSNITVYDTLENLPSSVVSYQIVGTDAVAIDTIYVWPEGYEYTYNENGIKIDSSAISTSGSIAIGDLDYYAKYPMDFEIMSFVTPYGIGLDLGIDGKTWVFDVTDFEPILHDSKRLFMSKGGEYQEEMDIQFLFIKGTPARDVIDIQQIWKVDAKSYTQIANDDYFEAKDVQLNPNAETFKIRSSITGHGQEGEFIQRTHFIDINGGLNEMEWEIWTECAENPVYPQGGTWIFDRAGWCPGAPSDVEEFYLESTYTPGSIVNLDYGVIFATGDSRYIVNNQLVSYGPINHSLDAGIKEIKKPTNRIEYARTNPACQDPVIEIQNMGSDKLTSLTITYGVEGGPQEIYQWQGDLDFLESEDVILPINTTKFWYSSTGSNKFVASISNPNGANDEYMNNNVMSSLFDRVPEFLSTLSVQVYTNKKPGENSYTIKDLYDNIVLERKQGSLSSETFYKDDLVLNTGCYSLEFYDNIVGGNGQNGLDFWYFSEFGRGSIELRDSINYEYLNPDFGAYVKYDFSVGEIYTNQLSEEVPYQLFTIFPNPANNIIYVELHGFHKNETSIHIYNAEGRLVDTKQFKQPSEKMNIPIDISFYSNGIYLLKVESGNQVKTRKFIKK